MLYSKIMPLIQYLVNARVEIITDVCQLGLVQASWVG